MWENFNRKQLIGLRVVCIEAFVSPKVLGVHGRILKGFGDTNRYPDKISADSYVIIESDEPFGGNNGRGHGRDGHCWIIPLSHLKLENEVCGPPLPEHLIQERKIIEKCRKLWNNSNFVKVNPKFVY